MMKPMCVCVFVYVYVCLRAIKQISFCRLAFKNDRFVLYLLQILIEISTSRAQFITIHKGHSHTGH